MNKRFIALSAALITALAMTGCSSSDSSSSGSSSAASSSAASSDTSSSSSSTDESAQGKFYISEECFKKDFGNIKDAEDGPLLSISNTKAKAGGIAKVTVSVKNAEDKWTMCGLHIVYPDLLKCVIQDEEQRKPEYTVGSAVDSEGMTVAREWQNNLFEDLVSNHMGAVFFTALCASDSGKDGDLATFSFRVPDDAKPGTVYNFDFYYSSNEKTKDMFSNEAGDLSFDKYAFSHATGGTVTVE